MVMFPHAGGSASFFHSYSAELSSNFRVHCVQYPGRQDRIREALIDNVGKLAEGVLADIARLDDGPLAFFGHSMGAVVAFETARLLQQTTGRSPVRLFVSGRGAPARPVPRTLPQFHLMSDADLTAEVQQSSATDARVAVDADLLRFVLPTLRSDYRAIETYRCAPGRRIACPITVLVGDRDPQVPLENAAAWAEHTTADSELITFQGGDHFYLLPSQDRVVKLIRDRLGRAPASVLTVETGRSTSDVTA
ncbi:alpha/beta fold hydrolase [Streptomyces sp. NPDC006539]|uniref:thioesterase II family protein n=1 Tax=Streptomyces sp. NPDC006539 TaxID=3155352 RepID=UPI00339FF511